MYISVIFLPLINFLLTAIGGRWIGHKGVSFLSPIIMFISFLLAISIFYEIILCHSVCSIWFFEWFFVGSLHIKWDFLFDSITAVMLVVVISVSMVVHIYAIDYMQQDPHLPRFMSYLSLFTFFMLMLITSGNYVQMFFGWEGVGLCSYLLINFWHTRFQAGKAAIKAIILNRIGDFGLCIALVIIFTIFRTFDFSVIFATASSFANISIYFCGLHFYILDLISFFLFIGAIGKSAQLGLHTWLPDAMEGPTPVSALIHAATMVTAGVFVIIRSSPIFEYTTHINNLIVIIGALTALFAATVGLVQNDLKRVIAYSTCSQLGYMVFISGLSNYAVGLFHLSNHAFFKALLFLSAGVVIHGLNDEQDMRKMGGLINFMPFTYLMILVGSLSLMGFPFLTGFYSKDLILEITSASYTLTGSFGQWLGIFAAICTAIYSTRLLYLTFLNEYFGPRVIYEKAHDGSAKMIISLLFLFIGSVFIGFISKDLFVGLGSDAWHQAIPANVYTNSSATLNSEFIPSYIKLLPVFFSIAGTCITMVIYVIFFSKITIIQLHNNAVKNIFYFFSKKWYFDLIYNNFIVKKLLHIGYYTTFKYFDRGLLELFGPTGLSRSINNISSLFSSLQSGFIYNYIFTSIIMLNILMSTISLNTISELDIIIAITIITFYISTNQKIESFVSNNNISFKKNKI